MYHCAVYGGPRATVHAVKVHLLPGKKPKFDYLEEKLVFCLENCPELL